MNNRKPPLAENQVICPISKSIMRHPVLVTTKAEKKFTHYYELDSLVAWLKKCCKRKILFTCPITRLPIIDVIYAKQLKAELDERFELNPSAYEDNGKYQDKFRYENYSNAEKNKLLTELSFFLHPWRAAIPKSVCTGVGIGLTVYCFNYFQNLTYLTEDAFSADNKDVLTISFLCAVMATFGDYKCRILNQVGFFGNVAKIACDFMNADLTVTGLDGEEEFLLDAGPYYIR